MEEENQNQSSVDAESPPSSQLSENSPTAGNNEAAKKEEPENQPPKDPDPASVPKVSFASRWQKIQKKEDESTGSEVANVGQEVPKAAPVGGLASLTKGIDLGDVIKQKVEENRRKKQKMKEAADAYFEMTTIGALPQAYYAKFKVITILWSAVFLVGVAMTIYHTHKIAVHYLSYPIKVQVFIKSEESMPFPAVTVCNLNPVKNSKIKCSEDYNALSQIQEDFSVDEAKRRLGLKHWMYAKAVKITSEVGFDGDCLTEKEYLAKWEYIKEEDYERMYTKVYNATDEPSTVGLIKQRRKRQIYVPPITSCKGEKDNNYVWPEKDIESSVSVPCNEAPTLEYAKSEMTRFCNKDGEWESDYSQCITSVGRQLEALMPIKDMKSADSAIEIINGNKVFIGKDAILAVECLEQAIQYASMKTKLNTHDFRNALGHLVYQVLSANHLSPTILNQLFMKLVKLPSQLLIKSKYLQDRLATPTFVEMHGDHPDHYGLYGDYRYERLRLKKESDPKYFYTFPPMAAIGYGAYVTNEMLQKNQDNLVAYATYMESEFNERFRPSPIQSEIDNTDVPKKFLGILTIRFPNDKELKNFKHNFTLTFYVEKNVYIQNRQCVYIDEKTQSWKSDGCITEASTHSSEMTLCQCNHMNTYAYALISDDVNAPPSCKKDKDKYYVWPKTEVGVTLTKPCPSELSSTTTNRVKKFCNERRQWETDFSLCTSSVGRNLEGILSAGVRNANDALIIYDYLVSNAFDESGKVGLTGNDALIAVEALDKSALFSTNMENYFNGFRQVVMAVLVQDHLSKEKFNEMFKKILEIPEKILKHNKVLRAKDSFSEMNHVYESSPQTGWDFRSNINLGTDPKQYVNPRLGDDGYDSSDTARVYNEAFLKYNDNSIVFMAYPTLNLDKQLFPTPVKREIDGEEYDFPRIFASSNILTVKIPERKITDLQNKLILDFLISKKSQYLKNQKCMYLDEETMNWKSDGCEMKIISGYQKITRCLSTHMKSYAYAVVADENIPVYDPSITSTEETQTYNPVDPYKINPFAKDVQDSLENKLDLGKADEIEETVKRLESQGVKDAYYQMKFNTSFILADDNSGMSVFDKLVTDQTMGRNSFEDFIKVAQLDDLKDVVDLANFKREEYAAYGYNIDEFLLECTMDRSKCNESNFQEMISSRYGNCFTFNKDMLHTNTSVQIVRRPGSQYGLRLTFNIISAEYIGLLAPEYGVRVTVHPSDTMPVPEDTGFNAPAGFQTSVSIKTSRIKRLPEPYKTNCTETFPEIYKGFADSWTKYSYQLCQKACKEYYIFKTCGCVKSFIVSSANKADTHKLCDIFNKTERICRLVVESQFYLPKDNPSAIDCGCRPKCEETVFKTSVSNSRWPSHKYMQLKILNYLETHEASNYFLHSMIEKDPDSKVQYNMDPKAAPLRPAETNLVRVHLYLESLTYQITEEVSAYPMSQLWADFGGAVGLYLGLTAASAIEIFQVIIVLIMTFIKKHKKDTPPAEKNRKRGGKPEDINNNDAQPVENQYENYGYNEYNGYGYNYQDYYGYNEYYNDYYYGQDYNSPYNQEYDVNDIYGLSYANEMVTPRPAMT